MNHPLIRKRRDRKLKVVGLVEKKGNAKTVENIKTRFLIEIKTDGTFRLRYEMQTSVKKVSLTVTFLC